MNTHIFEFDFSHGPSVDMDYAGANRLSRIEKVASVISDASPDLNDDLDVIRALYAEGMTCREWNDVFDEAVEMVREGQRT